nr:Ig-like domain-containing protein [Acidobacteriota bacterium]
DDFGEFGPPSTPREGEEVESNNQVEITLDPVDTEGVENTAVTLTGDAAITPEDALMVLQWQRKVGDEFIDLSGQTGTSFMVSPLTLDWDGAVVRFNAASIGDSAVSQEAIISVIPETDPPQVIRAQGNAIEERVFVMFSEPLSVASAEMVENYKITSAEGSTEVVSALLVGPRVVLLETSEMVVGAKYTISLNNIADTAATPNIFSGQVKFYGLGYLLPQTEDGLIVFEAESYDINTDDRWVENFSRGTPSGGVSMVLPNGAGGNEASSQLLYDVEFIYAGTHIVWYRASGDSGTDDSSWFWLDGERPGNRVDGNQASMTGFSGKSDFVWNSKPQDGPSPYTIEIDEPGMYFISLARREDGSFFDKFVITDDMTFDPNDFGPLGPPETREGLPAMPEVTLVTPLDGEEFESGEVIPLEVEIGASDREIVRVQYYAGGELVAESTTKPFSAEWVGAAAGEHDLSVAVIDDVNDSVVTPRWGHAFVTVVTDEPIQITGLDLDGTGANLIMEWQGGMGPYTVQKAASLSAPVWEDVGVDVESPLTLPVDGATGFFRVVAP